VAQRFDVSEEVDRLAAHVAEVRSVLERAEPIGRRLDFLLQEMNREANTLGSKSQDEDLTRTAVELKVLIEQMREQVQNLEKRRGAEGSPRGRVIVLAAPSSAGKTTLVRALLERVPNVRFSVSYTTRPRRPGERDGVDYFFVTREQFDEMLRRHAFLEPAQGFDDWYGTSREHAEDLLQM